MLNDVSKVNGTAEQGSICIVQCHSCNRMGFLRDQQKCGTQAP
jgi:hypothetical protein